MSQIISQYASRLSDFKPSSVFTKEVTRILSENVGANVTASASSTTSIFFAIPNKANSMINHTRFRLVVDISSASSVLTSTLSNGSAQSIIDSLQVYGSGGLLEDIQSYNVFMAHQEDHMSQDSLPSSSILSGSSDTDIKKGYVLDKKHRMCIDVFCCLGLLSDQYIPAIGNFRLKINLASGINALTNVTTGVNVPDVNYKLENMYLSVEYLTTTPEVFGEILADAGGIIKIHSKGVQTHTSSNSLDSTRVSQLVPIRTNSLSSVAVVFRDPGTINQVAENLGSRIRPLLSSFQFSINGALFGISISTNEGNDTTNPLSAEAYQSVIDFFHASNAFEVRFGIDEYMETAKSLDGSFSACIDLGEAGFSNGQLTGTDTTSGNIFLNLTLIPETNRSCLITCFAIYERLLMVDGNGATVMSE